MAATASPTPSGRRAPALARGSGFTYVGLIILVAIIALVAATTVRVGVTLQRAQAERDLLQIGEQFSNALKSYAAATPAGQPQQPPTLQELLKDPRFPGTRRHLRKIFVDPMTGRAQWGVIYIGDNKGVLGIHSLSMAAPIKLANFPERFPAFENRQKVADWVFTLDGQAPRPPALVKPGQPALPAAVPEGGPVAAVGQAASVTPPATAVSTKPSRVPERSSSTDPEPEQRSEQQQEQQQEPVETAVPADAP